MQKQLLLLLTSLTFFTLPATAGVIAESPIPEAPPVEKAWFATGRRGAAREQVANARAEKRAHKRHARKAELAAQLEPEDDNTRTALIFLDDYEITIPNSQPAILLNIIPALIEETGIIIASGSQLSQAFNSSYNGQNSQVTRVLALLRLSFNSEKWVVRKINEQSNLFLLLPKADFTDTDWKAIQASGKNNASTINTKVTTSLEIKLGIKIDHMLAIPEIEEAQEPQKAIQNYFDSRYEQHSKSASWETLVSDFMHALTNNNIFVPKHKNWNLPSFALYLIGHGAYKHSIAGMSIIATPGKRSVFQQLLDYLEKRINTKLFVYNSCYAAGFNAKLIYGELMEQGDTQAYPFAIATAASGDFPVAQRIEPILTSSLITFNISFKKFAQEVKKNIIDYKTALLFILPRTHIAGIAHVRPANSPAWFTLSELDTAVITIGRVKALVLEKNKQPLIIKQYKDSSGALKDPAAILVGTSTLNFPIIIDKNIKQIPTFISTLPGVAIHTFNSITYEGAPFDVGDFVGYGDIQYGIPKKFAISSILTVDSEHKPEAVYNTAVIVNGKDIFSKGFKADGSPHDFPAKKMFSKMLINACMNGNISDVTYALTNGADINFQNKSGNTALLLALVFGNKDLVRLLIDHGADTHLAENNGITPLHQAAASGNQDIVELVMKKGIKVNDPNPAGITALHSAVQGGNKDIVKLLINHGFNVNFATEPNFVTPLFFAAVQGKKEIAELLIENSANVNARSTEGYTPLHAAAETGNADIAELLIEKGAQVDTQNKEGDTALHGVAKMGNKEMVELLLKYGANMHIKNQKGETALDLAIQEKQDAVAAILREHEIQKTQQMTKNSSSAILSHTEPIIQITQ